MDMGMHNSSVDTPNEKRERRPERLVVRSACGWTWTCAGNVNGVYVTRCSLQAKPKAVGSTTVQTIEKRLFCLFAQKASKDEWGCWGMGWF